jgi:O-antigen ligase
VFLLANPLQLRERVASALFPHNDLEDSNAHRAELRRIGWEMIKANPWFGVGPEQVSKQYQDYIPAHMRSHAGQYYGHLENNYLQYAAERGIPTAVCLFWMIGWMLFDFARAVRRLPADAEERWPLHGAIAAILSILVSGFYSWSLNDSEVLGLFLAVMGAGYVAMWQAQAKKTPPVTVAEASLPLR